MSYFRVRVAAVYYTDPRRIFGTKWQAHWMESNWISSRRRPCCIFVQRHPTRSRDFDVFIRMFLIIILIDCREPRPVWTEPLKEVD